MSQKSHKAHYIQVAGVDVPAHKMWKKLETLSHANDVLDGLNRRYPALTSELTVETVEKVSAILKDLDVRSGGEQAANDDPNLLEHVTRLLKELDPETVASTISREYDRHFSLRELIDLVGMQPYLDTLRREASVLAQNAISPEQIAELWNDSRWPAPDAAFWHTQSVEKLLRTGAV